MGVVVAVTVSTAVVGLLKGTVGGAGRVMGVAVVVTVSTPAVGLLEGTVGGAGRVVDVVGVVGIVTVSTAAVGLLEGTLHEAIYIYLCAKTRCNLIVHFYNLCMLWQSLLNNFTASMGKNKSLALITTCESNTVYWDHGKFSPWHWLGNKNAN